MKNKYLSPFVLVVAALFAGVLIGGTAYLLNAQTSNGTWQPPQNAFPNTNGVSAPIDTGSVFQTKSQGMGFTSFSGPAIRMEAGQQIKATSTNGLTFLLSPLYEQITGATNLYNSGAFYMNTQGFVLPRSASAPANADTGMVYYNTGTKTVQLYNGGWTDIGTGTGSSQWQTVASGIQYTGGDVTINNGGVRPAGWYLMTSISSAVGARPADTSGPMSCDKDPAVFDCPNSPNPGAYYAGSGTYLDHKYDEERIPNERGKGFTSNFNIFTYYTERRGSNTASLNTANASVSGTATIGVLNADAINVNSSVTAGGTLQGSELVNTLLGSMTGFPLYTQNSDTDPLSKSNFKGVFYLVKTADANLPGGPVCGGGTDDRAVACYGYGGASCFTGNKSGGQESNCIGNSGSCIAVCFGPR